MRQHPRPTYGKARGQWPPQLDKGDSSAQFHGQMESARRLSLTVEFSAPLRCIRQRYSLTRRVFFMQGMKNRTECTLSRENETLPGAKPDSERNRYDPCTTERRRRLRRPPKRAGREKGGAKNTDLPFRRSAWYIYMVVQDSRTRRARPLQFVLHNAILLARAAGDRHPSSFAAYLLMGLPTMADFRPGGSRRFGASLRSQCRSRGVWVPRSFFTASCSLGALQTAATLDKQILDCPLCACPCSHTEPSLYYNSIAGACQPAAPIICGLYSAPSPAAFSASRPPFS